MNLALNSNEFEYFQNKFELKIFFKKMLQIFVNLASVGVGVYLQSGGYRPPGRAKY